MRRVLNCAPQNGLLYGDPGRRHVVEIESGWQDVSNIEIVVNVFILAMVVFNVC